MSCCCILCCSWALGNPPGPIPSPPNIGLLPAWNGGVDPGDPPSPPPAPPIKAAKGLVAPEPVGGGKGGAGVVEEGGGGTVWVDAGGAEVVVAEGARTKCTVESLSMVYVAKPSSSLSTFPLWIRRWCVAGISDMASMANWGGGRERGYEMHGVGS